MTHEDNERFRRFVAFQVRENALAEAAADAAQAAQVHTQAHAALSLLVGMGRIAKEMLRMQARVTSPSSPKASTSLRSIPQRACEREGWTPPALFTTTQGAAHSEEWTVSGLVTSRRVLL